jgi:hypothetical protein
MTKKKGQIEFTTSQSTYLPPTHVRAKAQPFSSPCPKKKKKKRKKKKKKKRRSPPISSKL